MSVEGLTRLAPQVIRPERHFVLVWDGKEEPKRSPEESQWWREAQAEVDAICTALKDWMPNA